MKLSTYLIRTFSVCVLIVSFSASSEAAQRCGDVHFKIEKATGGTSPYVVLRAGNRKGAFLLDYGTTRSSVSRDVFPGGGESDDIAIDDFLLPSFSSGRFRLAKYRIATQPAGGQIGIVGTDFLSLLTADFSFHDGYSDVVLGTQSCDRDGLRSRGMIAIHQRGYFSSDLRRLDARMPNVPVLFLNIDGVSMPAQIDTGYDDKILAPSIDINEALYEKLVASHVPLTWSRKITVATCDGVVTNDVYSVPQTNVALQTDEGQKIRGLSGVSLVRKGANGCGGIADMRMPFAQLGASIVVGLGNVVFDPRSELVWVAPGR